MASPTGTESAFAKTIGSFPRRTRGPRSAAISRTPATSTLTQINKSNVGRLKRIWGDGDQPWLPHRRGPDPADGRRQPALRRLEPRHAATPTRRPASPSWNSDPSTRETATGAARGLSVGAGKLFAGQGDGTLTAFDLATGKIAWKTLINTGRVPTYQPAAPIYFDGMVYTSLSGNDLGKLRGGIFAYDANTGALKWTFWISPLAGTPGANTWGYLKELETGGGGVWTYGAIDPQLKLLYEPTGNPSPGLRSQAGEEPLHRRDHRARPQDGEAPLVLPDGAPRSVGLRLRVPADPLQRQGQGEAEARPPRHVQERLRLPPRSRDGQARWSR